MRARILILLIAIDHLVLVLMTLGNCKRGETLSAAAWSLEQDGKRAGRIFRPLIDGIMFFDPYHCRKAHEAEVYGYQRPTRE